MLGSRLHIEFFNQASALSDMIEGVNRVGRELSEAVAAFRQFPLPELESLSGYRNFFDGTGLILPRWPKIRLLTKAEKRRRFKDRLKAKSEPAHVKRAKSLVHRYELTLRDILDAVMAEEYGEDWPDTRLPLCDCKDLLGKWKKRGGDVLDHADYVHYGRIMGYPDHFVAIFETAFADPQMVVDLMRTAGNLRAASHHGREFTPEDLRDLRVTWKTIETGLLVFTDDYEFVLQD
ncbi:hypothetical protein [Sinorhizobium terangae]|uniref:hypothetical protein n=1 Tax=Sinorhizobium terangae TaxID=110322 RepID=UPI0024B1855E|nr:hypothetical protein [Sinorhizobium terangae]WFU49107.1 hypothetical protein QA637_06815 [Sinorhizobium terangae]